VIGSPFATRLADGVGDIPTPDVVRNPTHLTIWIIEGNNSASGYNVKEVSMNEAD
jgi:hypothetical protein